MFASKLLETVEMLRALDIIGINPIEILLKKSDIAFI